MQQGPEKILTLLTLAGPSNECRCFISDRVGNLAKNCKKRNIAPEKRKQSAGFCTVESLTENCNWDI